MPQPTPGNQQFRLQFLFNGKLSRGMRMDNLKLTRYHHPILLVEAVAIFMSGDAQPRRSGIGRLQPSKVVCFSTCRAFTAIGQRHFGVRADWTRSVSNRGRASLAAIKSFDHFASPKPIMTFSMPELEHKAT